MTCDIDVTTVHMNVKKTIKLAREFTLFVVSIVTHMYTCTHVEGENCVGTTYM